MKILHNPEIRKTILISVLIVSAGTGFSLLFASMRAYMVLITGISLICVFAIEKKRETREIQRLSDSLDEVLNNGQKFHLEEMKEGDLAILQNEIAKAVSQLELDKESLQKERRVLARSIGDISHQLRTPLTALHLNLALLKKGAGEAERRKQFREAGKALTRMEDLVERLLRLSRLDADAVTMHREKILVKDLLDRAMESLKIPMDLKNVSCKIEDHDSELACDVTWTSEAFTNLLKNCLEHSPAGSCISVQAEENPLYTKIVIHDQGDGFGKEDLPHLFERFYRGKNASPDSIGIGLAMAEAVVTKQDGTIKAYNHKNGGAVFEVRFYKQII
jgi:signal transduction histidine kinase